MKSTIAAVIFAIIAAISLLYIWFQHTWIPDYGEAEPLQPVAEAFAKELSRKVENRDLTLNDLTDLFSKPQFSELKRYGFILSDKKDLIMTFKINEHFSFPIYRDGHIEFRGFQTRQTEQGAAANP